MFIGCFKLDGEEHFDIYYDGNDIRLWNQRTWSPTCENIETLDFTIKGKTYKEKKGCLQDIAIEWSNHFSQYSWSYGELAEIQDYFYENGKRYGLLREFKENGVC